MIFLISSGQILIFIMLWCNNDFINFENGHYRRFINTSIFVEKFAKKTKSRNIYLRSSKNLSIVKKDNPNLTRAIFKI